MHVISSLTITSEFNGNGSISGKQVFGVYVRYIARTMAGRRTKDLTLTIGRLDQLNNFSKLTAGRKGGEIIIP